VAPPIGPVTSWKRDFIIFGTLLGENEYELNLEAEFLVSSFPVSLEILKDKSHTSLENWLEHAPCLINRKTIEYSLLLI
jgi:hypothetical protein